MIMELQFVPAGPDDLDLLVDTRITVLKAANCLDDTADMTQVRQTSREYYSCALADGSHAAFLVMDGGNVVGTGGISFFRVMPTFHNPSGWKGYIMNMYTAPGYRRQGIAMRMLQLLVSKARERGITSISLEATEAGRPLYERFGFVAAGSEMELPAEYFQ